MGDVMFGNSLIYAWKRGVVILGGWILYIVISYRILSSMGKQPRHGWGHGLLWTSDVWAPARRTRQVFVGSVCGAANGGYGTSVLYANLPGPVGFIILF